LDYQSITEIYQEIQKTYQKDSECLNLIYNYHVSPDYRNLPKDFAQDLDTRKEINLICDKRKFKQELANEINRQFRYSGLASLTIFHFDLLKILSENSNYKYWDILILRLAEIISRRIRKSDILARWSKNVLLIANPNTKLASAINLSKRIRAEIIKQKFNGIDNLDCRLGVTALRPGEKCNEFLNRVESAIDLLEEKEDINLYIFS